MSNYVWLRFNPNQLLWEDKNLSPANIGKIIRIGVQIDYNNNIIFDNKSEITKQNLNQLLCLSQRAYEYFFKEALEKNLFYMNELNKYRIFNHILNKHVWNSLILNKEFIRKGFSNKFWNYQTYSERIKLYIKPTKELFDGVTYTQIGNLFLLIPFLDFNDNSISIDDAMFHLKYNKEKKKRFLSSLNGIKYINIDNSYITISKQLIYFKSL